MKINWKFWKRKEVKQPFETVTIPTSWMRYILAVLPDANEYYVKGTVQINLIPFDVVRQEPLAGQMITSPTPRVDTETHSNYVVFKFYEFGKEIPIPIVRSIETVSYGGQTADVETYLWDLSHIRVMGNAGWSAMCRYISDKARFSSNYILDLQPKEGENGIVPQSEREEGTAMNFKYEKPFWEQDLEKSKEIHFMREGEMPEQIDGDKD